MGQKQKKRLALKRRQNETHAPPALLDANPDLVMASVVDIFRRVGNAGGSPLASAVAMHDLLTGSALVDGFGVLGGGQGCFRAVWVEYGGEQFDPATAVLRALTPEFVDEVKLEQNPVGQRVDDERQDPETADSLRRFREDRDRWWREAPAGLARIRKFLRGGSAPSNPRASPNPLAEPGPAV